MGILQRQHLNIINNFTISYLDLKLSLTSSSEINNNRCSFKKGYIPWLTWSRLKSILFHYYKQWADLLSGSSLGLSQNLPPRRMFAKTKATFLALCSHTSQSSVDIEKHDSSATCVVPFTPMGPVQFIISLLLHNELVLIGSKVISMWSPTDLYKRKVCGEEDCLTSLKSVRARGKQRAW